MNEKNHVGRPTNEEVELRKKNKRLKVLLIIICILGVIALVYYGYNYIKTPQNIPNYEVDNNQNSQNNQKEEDKNEQQDDKKELESINITNYEVSKLYRYIPVSVRNGEKDAYQNGKVTIDNMSLEPIVRIAVLNMDISISDEKIKESEIEKKIKEIYNKNKKIENIDMIDLTYDTYITKYEDVWEFEGLISIDAQEISIESDRIRRLAKAEKDKNNLYIYDEVIFTNGAHGCEGDMEKNNITIFEDSNLKQKHNKQFSCELEVGEIEDRVMEDYKQYKKTYKHTFSKNSNGSYYYVSSEPVK